MEPAGEFSIAIENKRNRARTLSIATHHWFPKHRGGWLLILCAYCRGISAGVPEKKWKVIKHTSQVLPAVTNDFLFLFQTAVMNPAWIVSLRAGFNM